MCHAVFCGNRSKLGLVCLGIASYLHNRGKGYRLLENQNSSTQRCWAGNKEHPEDGNFQEENSEIYMKVRNGIE